MDESLERMQIIENSPAEICKTQQPIADEPSSAIGTQGRA